MTTFSHRCGNCEHSSVCNSVTRETHTSPSGTQRVVTFIDSHLVCNYPDDGVDTLEESSILPRSGEEVPKDGWCVMFRRPTKIP